LALADVAAVDQRPSMKEDKQTRCWLTLCDQGLIGGEAEGTGAQGIRKRGVIGGRNVIEQARRKQDFYSSVLLHAHDITPGCSADGETKAVRCHNSAPPGHKSLKIGQFRFFSS